MNVDKYLTMSCDIKHQGTADTYDPITCSFNNEKTEIKDVPCFMSGGKAIKRDGTNQTSVLTQSLLVKQEVYPGDIVLLDGTSYEVNSVSKVIDFDGSVSHYEAMVK